MPPKNNEDRKARSRGSQSTQKNQDGGAHGRNENTSDSSKNDRIASLTCKMCLTEYYRDDDKLVECERCELWECQVCAELLDVEYEALSKGSKMHWYCHKCNEEAVSAVKTSQLIETKCKQYVGELRDEIMVHINSEIATVHDEIASVKQFTEIQKSELATVKSDVDDLVSFKNKQTEANEKIITRMTALEGHSSTNKDTSVHEEIVAVKELTEEHKSEFATFRSNVNERLQLNAEDTIKEVQDRQDRKLNVIFFNIEESNAEDLSQAKTDDMDQARAILGAMDVTVPMSNPQRLGKKDDADTRARPLRVKLSNEQDIKRVLRGGAKLKESDEYKSIYVNRDMTPLERKEWRKLLEERRIKNSEAVAAGQDANWVIRNNRVVQREPRGGK